MILVIIFSFQYYFLAKVFNKNIPKTIFSAIGLYFACTMLFAFILITLIATRVLDIGIDFSKTMTPEIMRTAVFEFMSNSNIPIVTEILTFILIGIIYYNYLKRKWTFEMIESELEKRKEAVLENVEIKKKITPIKLNVYVHFHKVNEKNIHLLNPLAKEIWNDAYKEVLSQDQIDYMLEMMYNVDKVNEGIANGEIWEIVKVDNVPSGYLHYKFDENNTVFLSKIYIKTNDKTKGVGQAMMNHVIEYANDVKANAVQLTVNKENARAIRFYEKNGFKNIESKTFDIGSGYVMDDYIYQKSLVTKVPQL